MTIISDNNERSICNIIIEYITYDEHIHCFSAPGRYIKTYCPALSSEFKHTMIDSFIQFRTRYRYADICIHCLGLIYAR
ncbi:MAG: hypothetical protein ACI8RD_001867 [Bacillariaceae sp.]|jgi:hypothetical protein